MNLLKEKKGFSAIVSVVLVMAISVVIAFTAGTLLTSSISLTLAPAVSCTQMNILRPITIESTDYDLESNELSIMVSRALDDKLSSEIDVHVRNEQGETESWSCGLTCGSCTLPNEGSSRTYRFTTTIADPSSVTLSINGCVIDSYPVAG